ncbi:unnamed protein product [Calypogeia fissa]
MEEDLADAPSTFLDSDSKAVIIVPAPATPRSTALVLLDEARAETAVQCKRLREVLSRVEKQVEDVEKAEVEHPKSMSKLYSTKQSLLARLKEVRNDREILLSSLGALNMDIELEQNKEELSKEGLEGSCKPEENQFLVELQKNLANQTKAVQTKEAKEACLMQECDTLDKADPVPEANEVQIITNAHASMNDDDTEDLGTSKTPSSPDNNKKNWKRKPRNCPTF